MQFEGYVFLVDLTLDFFSRIFLNFFFRQMANRANAKWIKIKREKLVYYMSFEMSRQQIYRRSSFYAEWMIITFIYNNFPSPNLQT